MITYIYIFNNASRAATYGIGTYVRQLSDGLSSMPDTTISFVEMFADTKEFSITEDEQGQEHYKIPPLTTGMENEDYCRTIFYLLARNINTCNFGDRLVFQFNYFQHYPLAVLLKGYYPECRIILTVHYLNWCFELKGNLTRLHEIIAKEHEPTDETERAIMSSFHDEKTFLHLADDVLVLSKKTKEILKKDYKVSEDKLHIVYNGLGRTMLDRKNEEDSESERNILFVGRLDEIKGLKYLISAFEKIFEKHTKTSLIIVGDGDFQPYLAQSRKMSGRISFLGKVPSDKLEDVYEKTYIGVTPSFHEQCSYSVIEMMRHGIPFVGTDSTGLSEMLDATPQLRVHINEERFDEEKFVEQIASCLDILLSDSLMYKRASDAVAVQYQARYRLPMMIDSVQRVVTESFSREGYTISPDFFEHIDVSMMRLVDKRPDIDTDFFGMSGIGVYLWWRERKICDNPYAELLRTKLQEYLIYYLDWLYEAANNSELPEEVIAVLADMERNGFYKTKVKAIIETQPVGIDVKAVMPSEGKIIRNSIKICNCKV